MKPAKNTDKSLWLPLLAVLFFVCELLAWWWVTQLRAGDSLQGPTTVGLLGGLSALAISLLAWQRGLAEKLKAWRTRRLLGSCLDTLDVGLVIWDAQDRLVLYNKKINQMRIDFHAPTDIGKTFETLVRAKLDRHLILAAVGHEQEWLAQRLATRGLHKEPLTKEYAGNQWFKNYETRTPEGYLVASWVDVTELVRKGRSLADSNARLAQQSSMDNLTGLANRRQFDEALVHEWQRASRNPTPLSLLIIDIDHFKLFNDNYGHVAGDECLRRVAGVLSSSVRRSGELVARYGGEKFVVLLPGSDVEHACETAEKCLAKLHQEAIQHVTSLTCAHVTISIGIACSLPDAALEPESIVNAADAAMYRAKSGGRARYEVADQADLDIDKDTPRTQPAALN